MMVRTLLIALISMVAFVLEFACTKDHDNKQYIAQELENTPAPKQELAKSIDPILVNTESDVWYMGGPSGWDKTIIFRSNGSFFLWKIGGEWTKKVSVTNQVILLLDHGIRLVTR